VELQMTAGKESELASLVPRYFEAWTFYLRQAWWTIPFFRAQDQQHMHNITTLKNTLRQLIAEQAAQVKAGLAPGSRRTFLQLLLLAAEEDRSSSGINRVPHWD
jgi:hypothetical protein